MSSRIGHWQEKMLGKMLLRKRGAFYLLMNLKGNASRYKSRYESALLNAIDKHNSGELKSSPIPKEYEIAIGAYGKKGGFGYRLIPKAFL